MMATKRSRDDEAEQFKMVGKLTKPKPKPKPKKKSNKTGDVTMKSLSERENHEDKKSHAAKNEEEKKKWDVYDDQNNARVDVMEGIWDEWPLSYWCCVGENEMFWEYLKVPVWDEDDFRGGFCGYNEIIWEDDIWHLKDIKEVPKSCSLAL